MSGPLSRIRSRFGREVARRSKSAWWQAIRAGIPFGLRTALAASIALAIAFELELDKAYWAGTTAAIVCQPVLGSALRKALFRMAGTIAGATAAVVLFACFPQDRIGFTLSFAGWCALCAFVGSRLTFFAGYGAMLAGYSAAIITGDVINAPDHVFDVVLARVTEIELGIVVATVVLATTQFGDSRQRLAETLRTLAEQAVADLLTVLDAVPESIPGRPGCPAAAEARDRLTRLASVAQTIDQVTGEATHWRFRLASVRTAQDGLFACYAGIWRLRASSGDGPAPGRLWRALPGRLRDHVTAVVQPHLLTDSRAGVLALLDLAEREPAAAPRAVRAARVLAAAADALEVAAWLANPDRPHPAIAPALTAPADPLPALNNAGRAYASIVVATILWMATRWPNGPGAITWTAIPVLLMAPQQEKAADAAAGYSMGVILAAGMAAIMNFAVLPRLQTFGGLAAVLSLVLVPLAVLSTIPRVLALIGPAMINFIPLLAPTNQMTYDTGSFYNASSGIVVGCAIAAVALCVWPPVPLRIRERRVVASAAADCAAIGAAIWRPTPAQWRDRMRTRASGMPEAAEPQSFVQLLVAFSSGDDTLHGGAGSPPIAIIGAGDRGAH